MNSIPRGLGEGGPLVDRLAEGRGRPGPLRRQPYHRRPPTRSTRPPPPPPPKTCSSPRIAHHEQCCSPRCLPGACPQPAPAAYMDVVAVQSSAALFLRARTRLSLPSAAGICPPPCQPAAVHHLSLSFLLPPSCLTSPYPLVCCYSRCFLLPHTLVQPGAPRHTVDSYLAVRDGTQSRSVIYRQPPGCAEPDCLTSRPCRQQATAAAAVIVVRNGEVRHGLAPRLWTNVAIWAASPCGRISTLLRTLRSSSTLSNRCTAQLPTSRPSVTPGTRLTMRLRLIPLSSCRNSSSNRRINSTSCAAANPSSRWTRNAVTQLRQIPAT